MERAVDRFWFLFAVFFTGWNAYWLVRAITDRQTVAAGYFGALLIIQAYFAWHFLNRLTKGHR